jgi:two-component system, NarL family, nitrate/nitrite response regulator NarL
MRLRRCSPRADHPSRVCASKARPRPDARTETSHPARAAASGTLLRRRLTTAESPSIAPRTLIVSDVCLYREGLALALERRGDIQLVGTADSLDAARTFVATGECAVVLLDGSMPHALGIARTLMLIDPSMKIVAVAVADEAADVVACAQAGLDGYVPRDGSISDVADAIHSAMHGELRCSPRIAATLFKRLAALGPVADVVETPILTARETEVAELIDRGLSNKQIAQRLRIGTATVKNHVHNILEKLQVNRRAEAAAHLRGHPSTSPATSSRRRSSTSRPPDPMI